MLITPLPTAVVGVVLSVSSLWKVGSIGFCVLSTSLVSNVFRELLVMHVVN